MTTQETTPEINPMEMMKECCGEGAMPDFEMMKTFMEKCGKEGFSGDEIAMMKQFCGGEKADPEKMKQLVENCGCRCS